MVMVDVLQTLCCPRCQGDLSAMKHGLECQVCAHDVPLWGSTPWLFPDPMATKAEWKNRYEHTLAHYESVVQGLQKSLQSTLRESTQKRLRRHAQFLGEQRKSLMKVLSPLELKDAARVGAYQAGHTSLPESQPLMGYYHNVLRDWAWGDEENQVSLAIVQDLLDGVTPTSRLVLGSGAGRLAYDFHQAYDGITVATDLNPFLLWVSKKMASFQSLTLKEFAVSPKNQDDAAQSWKCRAPQRSKDGLEFILHNAFDKGFKEKSFECVLTPWFLDIVPEDILTSATMVNRLLPEGGVWVNFGSLAFFHEDKARCYSRAEVLEIVQDAGFEVLKTVEQDIPYMNSPSSCQKRFENIFGFSLRKIKDVTMPETEPEPLWLKDVSKPVERRNEFEDVGFSQKLVGQVLLMVDGQKSVKDLAKSLSQETGLESQQCEGLVVQMLRQVYVNHQKDQAFR